MSGTKRIAANIPMPTMKLVAVLTANVRSANRPKGTIGSECRRSTANSTTPIAAATASSVSTSGEVQSWSRVIERPTSSGTRLPASASAPARSMLRHVAVREAEGIVLSTKSNAAMPTGRLT